MASIQLYKLLYSSFNERAPLGGLLSLEHLLGLASVVAQVLLICHQQVQVDDLLVEQHARDLANHCVAVHTLNAGVDHVTDKLLLLIHVLYGSQRSHTLSIRQRNNRVRLSSGLVFVLRFLPRFLVLALSASARSLTTSSASSRLLLTSIATAVGLTSTHQLIADLIDGGADEFLHLLLLLGLALSIQINFGHPEFDIDRLVAERPASKLTGNS